MVMRYAHATCNDAILIQIHAVFPFACLPLVKVCAVLVRIRPVGASSKDLFEDSLVKRQYQIDSWILCTAMYCKTVAKFQV